MPLPNSLLEPFLQSFFDNRQVYSAAVSTNVERIKYSYKLSFETDEDRNRYKRPSSWINILSVKTASFKELEELIPFVSQGDQPLLKELIQVLKKSVSEKTPLSQNKLNKYRGMLKRNNRVMAKLAELLLKYLIG
uniref:hypothetical protein n=1 Tax=Lentilactobacillus hilgardii TaxID=1588 RepID=UPI00403F27E4